MVNSLDVVQITTIQDVDTMQFPSTSRERDWPVNKRITCVGNGQIGRSYKFLEIEVASYTKLASVNEWSQMYVQILSITKCQLHLVFHLAKSQVSHRSLDMSVDVD